MISKCKVCGAECVHHTPMDAASNRCWGGCFSVGTLEPMTNPEQAGEVAKSWEGLLGKSSEELRDFCQGLAEDVAEDKR